MNKKKIKRLALISTNVKDMHTNGHLLLMCKPKIQPLKKKRNDVYMSKSFITQKMVDNLFKYTCPIKIKTKRIYHSVYGMEVVEFTDVENRLSSIDKKYYDYIKYHYNDAVFRVAKDNPENSPIGVFVGNKKVGYVMPVRIY